MYVKCALLFISLPFCYLNWVCLRKLWVTCIVNVIKQVLDYAWIISFTKSGDFLQGQVPFLLHFLDFSIMVMPLEIQVRVQNWSVCIPCPQIPSTWMGYECIINQLIRCRVDTSSFSIVFLLPFINLAALGHSFYFYFYFSHELGMLYLNNASLVLSCNLAWSVVVYLLVCFLLHNNSRSQSFHFIPLFPQ